MRAFRLSWNGSVDFDWLLSYHRSHPFLKYVDTINGFFGIVYGSLCAGLLVTPDLVVGAPKRAVVSTCGILAVCISVAMFKRRIATWKASIVFVVSSDVGISAVLLCMTPSPVAILGSALFTGIGNYAAVHHGAKVFVAHYGLMLAVLATLAGMALASEQHPAAAVWTATGTAFIVLFTSSILMQALVSQMRQDAAGALFDALTGLRNRRGLEVALDDLFRDRPEMGTVLYAIVVDLDGFKSVNDTFGHDFGDLVLRRTAVRIEICCPPPAVTARVGGEEFIVVGTGTDSDARQLAYGVVAAVFDDRDDTPVTASVGLATVPAQDAVRDTRAAVLQLSARADSAMYEAKRSGGHRVGYASADT